MGEKIKDDASLREVPPEITILDKKIKEAAIKWNYKSKSNFKPEDADYLDKAATENFQNGLAVIQKTDTGRYKKYRKCVG